MQIKVPDSDCTIAYLETSVDESIDCRGEGDEHDSGDLIAASVAGADQCGGRKNESWTAGENGQCWQGINVRPTFLLPIVLNSLRVTVMLRILFFIRASAIGLVMFDTIHIAR